MKNSKISWTHHTVNFWWGCTKVSPACASCYALAIARIWKKDEATWGPAGLRWVRTARALEELRKLDESAEKRRVRERVFINSMSDTFEARGDLNGTRAEMFAAFETLKHLDLLLLTKRPEQVMNMVPAAWRQQWPTHVWIGTTVEDQRRADERLPVMLKIPAAVRFLSCEPLLEEVKLSSALEGIQWVIAGGESGASARPLHPDWARSVRDECLAAGVPFFFKQWGGRGKATKENGSSLDGRTWEQFPCVRTSDVPSNGAAIQSPDKQPARSPNRSFCETVVTAPRGFRSLQERLSNVRRRSLRSKRPSRTVTLEICRSDDRMFEATIVGRASEAHLVEAIAEFALTLGLQIKRK